MERAINKAVLLLAGKPITDVAEYHKIVVEKNEAILIEEVQEDTKDENARKTTNLL